MFACASVFVCKNVLMADAGNNTKEITTFYNFHNYNVNKFYVGRVVLNSSYKMRVWRPS